MPQNEIPFAGWIADVDRLCRVHLVCSWADLCGDIEPLRTAFEAGESPIEFVQWWAEKHALIWIEPS